MGRLDLVEVKDVLGVEAEVVDSRLAGHDDQRLQQPRGIANKSHHLSGVTRGRFSVGSFPLVSGTQRHTSRLSSTVIPMKLRMTLLNAAAFWASGAASGPSGINAPKRATVSVARTAPKSPLQPSRMPSARP